MFSIYTRKKRDKVYIKYIAVNSAFHHLRFLISFIEIIEINIIIIITFINSKKQITYQK